MVTGRRKGGAADCRVRRLPPRGRIPSPAHLSGALAFESLVACAPLRAQSSDQDGREGPSASARGGGARTLPAGRQGLPRAPALVRVSHGPGAWPGQCESTSSLRKLALLFHEVHLRCYLCRGVSVTVFRVLWVLF